MKVKITQNHIDSDNDVCPAIVRALRDALPDHVVGMIHDNPTIKRKSGDGITSVISLSGGAGEFETKMMRGEEVFPCEVEIDLAQLARNPRPRK
jgi:hypothetical protein